MGPGPRPPAEVTADEALVAALVGAQHPDLAAPVRRVAEGWDNVVFRLGDEHAVRMPRRQLGADLVASELRWLPDLARRLPLAVPEPVRSGAPGLGYPWSWSIVRWVPGASALDRPPVDLQRAATALGRFVAALRRPAPTDAPRNPHRGVPLAERDALTAEQLAHLPGAVDRRAVAAVWRAALSEPPWADEPVWVHGDLHPGNLVVADGHLSGVLDFGDLTSGDPATDLMVGWMLFPAIARPLFRAAAGPVDDATWARARGWALAHAVAVLTRSADDPPMAAMARRTLDAVLADRNG